MWLNIEGFDWDNPEDSDGNVAHIARHEIIPEEVEEVFEEDLIVRRGRKGYRLAYGQTCAGRYLLVVFVLKPGNILRVVTARDLDEMEKRYYRRERR
jgi:uncharacterized DUF497 family protein